MNSACTPKEGKLNCYCFLLNSTITQLINNQIRSPHQLIGLIPFEFKYSLALEKWPQPKKPR